MSKQRIKFNLLIHDLKVPLAVIEAGILSLLQRTEKYGPITEKQGNVLRRVLRNAKVTQTLVNDALEVGRSSEGINSKNRFIMSYLINQSLMELFDLTDNEATDKIKDCKDLQTLKQILSVKGIILDIDERLWCKEVILDERKMSQILRNLLSNALKYRKDKVQIGISLKDGSLTVSVIDDGLGIPVSFHENIFRCYFQMDDQKEHCVRGHGLGLAGVMVLVEDMGGELFLESDLGRGAKFSVRLPVDGV